MKKINHIGIAVKNLNNAIKIYQSLGFKISTREKVESQKVNIAFINIGESRIELLEPSDANSPIQKFINKHGEGIHHVAIEVENINEKLNKLKRNGIKLIDQTPRDGSHGLKIAFIHPKSTGGVLLELCEGK